MPENMQPAKKLNKKWGGIFVLVIIVLVIGVALRFVPKKALIPPKEKNINNTNQATEWQTYTDEKSGVTVKVPPKWVAVSNESSNPGVAFVFMGPTQAEASEFNDGINFSFEVINPSSPVDKLSDWIDKNEKKYTNRESLTWSGKEVIKIEPTFTIDPDYPATNIPAKLFNYYVLVDDKIDKYSCSVAGDGYTAYLDLCEQTIQNNVK